MHSHDCEAEECGAEWSLFKHIDTPRVSALNESVEGSVQKVLRSWDQRLDFEHCLESNDGDPELLIHIPFTTDVKLKAISVIGGRDGTAPLQMRAFTNRDDLDFSAVQDLPPVQEWRLVENSDGELEYNTKYSKFQGVANLTLHFPESGNGEMTRINFIGLKGEATKNDRKLIATVVYEALGQPKDHKIPGVSSRVGAAPMT